MDAIDCGQIVIEPRTYRRTDRHFLGGVVKVDGAPASRRVALFLRVPLTLVAVTQSRRDGTYEFSGIPEFPERSLKAVAYDDAEQKFNAQVCDFLTQDQEPAVKNAGGGA